MLPSNPSAFLSCAFRRPRRKRPIGLYFETRSTLDGRPIVVIFTGLGRKSENAKTGPMIQVWILTADRDPLDAVCQGEDSTVCGNCKLRWSLGGACYVNLAKAPLTIYWTWKRGGYHPLDLDNPQHLEMLRRRPLRLGAYGDPASVPMAFWSRLFTAVAPSDWTGYTHQWRVCPDLRPYVMASVDSPAELTAARQAGWRTFRVKRPSDSLLPGEFTCPASKSKRVTCARCGLCNGTTRKADSPAIDVHGIRARRFVPLQTLETA